MPSEENPPAQDRSARIAGTLLLALALLWCIYWFVHSWHYWEDDAYIHLEFARSLATGHGFAFNGRVVAGETAPLWVFLLVATHTLVPDWLLAGKVLTALGAALGLSGTYAFARRLASTMLPSRPDAAVFPAALVLLIAANPYFCYWAFSGMESIAASGLAFYAVLAATRARPTAATFLAACLLTGIGPLLRPEMFFLAALLALPLLGQWRRLPGGAGSASKVTACAVGLLLAAAPLALWSLYSLHAFGHLLPNTNAAKRAGPADSVVLHLLSIYSLGLPLILCGFAAGFTCLLLRPAAVRRSLGSAVTAALSPPAEAAAQPACGLPLGGWVLLLWPSAATLFYIADHTYVQTRYILVTAPGLTLVILLLALQLSQRAGRVLYLAALVAALAVSVVIVRPFVRNKALNCQTLNDLALFIHDRLPPGAPVADYSIGEMAFVSQHPIVDIGGITRPGAIPYLNAPPEAMLQWARSQGAQYCICSHPGPGAVLADSVNQRFIGWSLHTARYATSNRIELWKLAPDAPASGHEGPRLSEHTE